MSTNLSEKAKELLFLLQTMGPLVSVETAQRLGNVQELIDGGWIEIVSAHPVGQPEQTSAYYTCTPAARAEMTPKKYLIPNPEAARDIRYIGAQPFPATMNELRALIKQAVQHALYPGGLPDPHEYRRVELVEESGKRWRGMVYAVEEESQ